MTGALVLGTCVHDALCPKCGDLGLLLITELLCCLSVIGCHYLSCYWNIVSLFICLFVDNSRKTMPASWQAGRGLMERSGPSLKQLAYLSLLLCFWRVRHPPVAVSRRFVDYKIPCCH